MDLFVYDLARAILTRLTFDSLSDRPLWTPDGSHILFGSDSSGPGLWSVRSDGSEQPQQLLKSQNRVVPWSISPDGRRLAYWESNPGTGYDISILPLDLSDPAHIKAGSPEPFLRTPANEAFPTFSPDGRWIAYYSNESGIGEIYVRSSSGTGGKWQISNGGSLNPIWNPQGGQLFFEGMDNRIMVVDYTSSGSSFSNGTPRRWSDRQIYAPGKLNLAISPDGKRFAVFEEPETAKAPPHIVFLLNFVDELKRRIPAR
jgi:Tol biopolymer transport system component